MVLTLIKAFFGVFAAVQGTFLTRGFIKHREPGLTAKHIGVFWGSGFVLNFLDYLGIGSYAPTMALYKLTKTVDDDILPGTLVVGCVVPVAFEALFSLSIIEVELVTLFAMYISGAIGSLIGGRVASKLPVHILRPFMGGGLFIVATLLVLSKLGLYPLGGEEIGLHGIKLVIGCIGCFIFAALVDVGIGNYAPTMCMVYLLGMDPRVAFPIMMGVGFLSVCSGSIPYMKSERYHHHAGFAFALAGIPGVLVAAFIIKSMPLSALQWLVIVVCYYTSTMMFRDAAKARKAAQAAA